MTDIANASRLSAGAKMYFGVEDGDDTHAHPVTRDAAPDPYAPGSPDYAQRHRKVEMMLPGGVLRVDYGALVTSPN